MKKSKIISLAFAGSLIMLMAAGICLPQKGFSQEENRFLEKKPEFGWKALLDGSYGEKYDVYLSDQFPMRNHWVSLKTNLELILGQRDVNGVYFGKDDYYIEKYEEDQIHTKRLSSNLEYVSQFMARMERELSPGRVKVMLVPSASQILKDKLPAFAPTYDQSQVTEELAEAVGQENMVELEETLKIHEKEEIYYRTDHHWTTLGAYYGYVDWAKAVGIQPWDREAFAVETIDHSFLGTIQSKVNVDMKPDVIRLFLPKTPAEYQVYYDGEETAQDSLYQPDALKTKDKYRVFLDGNHGWTKIVNKAGQSSGEERKLLVIKDSYANSFAPFAANHFTETHMIDLRYFNSSVEGFVREQGITDILLLYQIPGFSKDRYLVKLKN